MKLNKMQDKNTDIKANYNPWQINWVGNNFSDSWKHSNGHKSPA